MQCSFSILFVSRLSLVADDMPGATGEMGAGFKLDQPLGKELGVGFRVLRGLGLRASGFRASRFKVKASGFRPSEFKI